MSKHQRHIARDISYSSSAKGLSGRVLIRAMENEARHEGAKMIKRIENETREQADKKAKR